MFTKVFTKMTRGKDMVDLSGEMELIILVNFRRTRGMEKVSSLALVEK